jgi:hypothetical protein
MPALSDIAGKSENSEMALTRLAATVCGDVMKLAPVYGAMLTSITAKKQPDIGFNGGFAS